MQDGYCIPKRGLKQNMLQITINNHPSNCLSSFNIMISLSFSFSCSCRRMSPVTNTRVFETVIQHECVLWFDSIWLAKTISIRISYSQLVRPPLHLRTHVCFVLKLFSQQLFVLEPLCQHRSPHGIGRTSNKDNMQLENGHICLPCVTCSMLDSSQNSNMYLKQLKHPSNVTHRPNNHSTPNCS